MEPGRLFIGGRWVDAESGETYAVLNPATEEVLGRAALGGPADVDKAVRAAEGALPAWSALTPSERARIICSIGAAIRDAEDELVELEVKEHGTPLRDTLRGCTGAGLVYSVTGDGVRLERGVAAADDAYQTRSRSAICDWSMVWRHTSDRYHRAAYPPYREGLR